MIKLMSERDADECAKFGEVLTWSDDDNAAEVPITYLAESLKETPRTSGTTPPESDDDNVPIVKTIIDAKRQSNFVGMKVARDFGKTGVFIGEVVDLEYDSDDVGREAPFYVVRRAIYGRRS
jgi:hypothetical protein